jgi:hypothetical protein
MRRGMWILGTLCTFSVACDSIAPSEVERERDDASVSTGNDEPDAQVQCDTIPPARDVRLDASSQTDWVYFNLTRGGVVKVTDEQTSRDWDIAFKRFSIKLNGGVSGTGGAEAVVLKEAFDSVSQAPASGFVSDAPDGEDTDTEADYLLSTGDSGWYDYDPNSHTLTARSQVYVVRAVDDNVFKLAVQGYYNDAGSSGYPVIRYQPLSPLCVEQLPPEPDAGGEEPGEPDAGPTDGSATDADAPSDDGGADAGEPELEVKSFAVAATASDAWVYVSASEGVVTVADPKTSSAWDLAFQRVRVQTNSGSSGAGQGGALLLTQAFDEVLSVPSEHTVVADELLTPAYPPNAASYSGNTPLNGWWDNDPVTHVTTPKNVAYLIRRADGSYAKLRFTSYSGGNVGIDVAVLPAPSAP